MAAVAGRTKIGTPVNRCASDPVPSVAPATDDPGRHVPSVEMRAAPYSDVVHSVSAVELGGILGRDTDGAAH